MLFYLGAMFCLIGGGCIAFDPTDSMLQVEGLGLIGISLLLVREGIIDVDASPPEDHELKGD
ncbi:hypothetical protein [Pseudomonas sp. MAG002Y]|uniref:hypothetical protein n=1 Tax=Pseudomonas sp. MAG002Y TaxID=2678690 RepID=UPI001C60DC5F|nr:hypothetical protein [Pseudomonas sp. MAG002Y]MBW5416241.1 hypothetical protein [Pseudomonas sp. MAG002Y]